MSNIFHKILFDNWGYKGFRPQQYEIINSISKGKDTLGLLPTGGGKSITFQVFSLASDGLCIVVTPLISLMKDQVDNLKQRNIKALAIYSGMSRDEIDTTLNNCIYGDYKFLYVSPERLATELFKIRVQGMKINLIAIDEAHCISQWGYDFRPAYLEIANFRELLPDIPVLALTATATPKVVDDIMDKLHFKEKIVFKNSFERKNLVYWVKNSEDKLLDLKKICQRYNSSGIVYVRSRKKTKEITKFLQRNKISADYYHAGLMAKTRDQKQLEWKNNRTKIMVATNAFGMGIDKPDVGFVVHMDLPDSLEAYFQEAGRAGRSGNKAFAILLYNKKDSANLKRNFTNSFPEIDYIKKVYNSLGNYNNISVGGGKNQSYDFKLKEFALTYKYNALQAYQALKILQSEGYISISDAVNTPSKVKFLIQRTELYEFQIANVAFDYLIKTMLRSYTGMFTEYVQIDETVLAQRLKCSVEIVYKYLQRLNNLKLLRYIPQKNNPVIFYREERLETKNLYISQKNYSNRKQIYLEKLNSTIHYAETTNRCRSQLLLQYFGQLTAPECKQCDYCIKIKKQTISTQQIRNEVFNLLKKKPMFPAEFINHMHGQTELFSPVIKKMLDNKEISRNKNGKLYIPQKD